MLYETVSSVDWCGVDFRGRMKEKLIMEVENFYSTTCEIFIAGTE